MGRMLFANQQNWIEWALYGALSTLLVLVFCLLLIRDFQRIRRLKLGLACELAVGQELERLIRPEGHPYFVFHDVPGDGRSLDHVAVTPHGIFVVETRARPPALSPGGQEDNRVVVEATRLRFPGWSERAPMHRTREAARWLATWLERQVGEAVPVKGVLALPGWRVEEAGAKDDLLVVNGEDLARRLSESSQGEIDTALHDAAIVALRQRASLASPPPAA
jgi:hypothetical protein